MKGKIWRLVVHIILLVALFWSMFSALVNLRGALMWLELFAISGLLILAVLSCIRFVQRPQSRILTFFYIITLLNIITLSLALYNMMLFSGLIAIVGIIFSAFRPAEQEAGMEREAEQPVVTQVEEPKLPEMVTAPVKVTTRTTKVRKKKGRKRKKKYTKST